MKIQSTNRAKTTRNKLTKRLTITAMLTALNIIFSSFSLPVPGGHLYLNDIIICVASILVDPVSAFVVGGIGAFVGDLIFYPAPMFVSLFSHGVQAVLISICVHYLPFKKHEPINAIIGLALGGAIMVAGYTFGRAFIYSTPEYAVVKLPFEFLQSLIGIVMSLILCYALRLKRILIKANLLPFCLPRVKTDNSTSAHATISNAKESEAKAQSEATR